MNAGVWIGIGGVLVAGLALAWQMRRDNRSDRTAQLNSAIAEARSQVELTHKVDGLDEDLSQLAGRVRRLEQWRDQAQRRD
ncbi:MAG TPA: hypothetical protein VE441_14900 [Mycobacterium sp.]|nr:hypothetical protein [Mycobacterium sp.]